MIKALWSLQKMILGGSKHNMMMLDIHYTIIKGTEQMNMNAALIAIFIANDL